MLMKFGDNWIDPWTITAVIPWDERTAGGTRPAQVTITYEKGQVTLTCESYAEATTLAAEISRAVNDSASSTPGKP